MYMLQLFKYSRHSVRLVLALFFTSLVADAQTPVWSRFEKQFVSSKSYGNPLYQVQKFEVHFTSPSGRTRVVDGFWDGGTDWKVRFSPDETGSWTFRSFCSDTLNSGLHQVGGTFACTANTERHDIYQKGAIMRPRGSYHLAHSDGTPFFYTACTAWNGTLKSTDAEWETYLADRARNHYNTIQFTTTQWRGGDKNSEGQVAFEGSGRITLNPAFFQHLDHKVDAINRHGLVAAPVLLWALQGGPGRELSPGYYLPDAEAILLARYMVARYGAHHVVWILGGDGRYTGEYEHRWKNIGRGVFGREHPGVVALHPGGRSWIGQEFKNEDWLDIVGYQTGHNFSPSTINWITRGPAASEWAQLPAKVLINMEPCYEDILPQVQAREVRLSSYWSVFGTPVGGITYGANGIWPWIREGEEILNHSKPASLKTWEESIRFPGSIQIGKLGRFMQQLPGWWNLRPAQEVLLTQRAKPEEFISVLRSDDQRQILVYTPGPAELKLRITPRIRYTARWFDPVSGNYSPAQLAIQSGVMTATHTGEGDRVLVVEGQ